MLFRPSRLKAREKGFYNTLFFSKSIYTSAASLFQLQKTDDHVVELGIHSYEEDDAIEAEDRRRSV